MLNVTWHLLTTGALYDDPGADSFLRRDDPAVEAMRLQKRIEALGFEVTVAATAAKSQTHFSPRSLWRTR
jgi:hypothetical protein